DEVHTVNEVATLVAEAMARPREVVHLAARHEVRHAWSSHEKTRRIFEPPAPIPFREGVRRMARWAEQAGSRQSKPFGALEIAKSFPESWRRDLGETEGRGRES
ncbi:MAG: hypothetical protein ACREQY_13800, partial [Candidatus Binatia bacterium]